MFILFDQVQKRAPMTLLWRHKSDLTEFFGRWAKIRDMDVNFDGKVGFWVFYFGGPSYNVEHDIENETQRSLKGL